MELNNTIATMCDGVAQLQTPERFDIISSILKSQGMIIVITLIIIPLIISLVLNMFIDYSGKMKKSNLVTMNFLIMLVSLVIGVISYLILSVA
ncbi:MAG TPA: hypothetical protein DC057_11800 [Spirochaetia bacterium]|nr:hypothetical protein [Spirochaetia bacterium]